MSKRAQIAEMFRNIVSGNSGQLIFFPAQVSSVEGKTCTVVVDGVLISEVRLTPTTTIQDGVLLLTPAVDSFVLVGSLSGDLNNLCVLASDYLESVLVIMGDTSLFADKDGITFNGGKLGGLVKLEELTKKINTLENQVNELKRVFNAWSPVPNDGGSSLKGAVTNWSVQTIMLTKKNELENERVKQ